MSEVKRYATGIAGGVHGPNRVTFEEDDEGPWVYHSDIAAILAEHREMREALVIYVQGHPFQAAIAEDRAKELLARISAREEGEKDGR